jgi:nucleotide-binding universal stress UspA family protein
MQRAEESLLRLLRQAHTLGLKARSVTEIGDPIRVMRDYVARERITLAMVSVTGPEVARRLLREVPCAMLLVRVVHPGRMASPHEILVPVYGGELEGGRLEAAAELLANLGAYWHARIVLFQLRQPLTRLFDRRRVEEEAPEQAKRKLAPFIAALSRRGLAPGTRVSWSRRHGPGITAEAAARRHDLIFLGTKGPKRFLQWLRTGTIDHVVRKSPCDLILFRPAVA